ncbi:MAG: glycosyltransferase [Arenimonas sp.]
MRILHVVPTYLPAVRYGGPIVSVHALCGALVQRGHDVEVFTTNVDGEDVSNVSLDAPSFLDGVKVNYFPVSRFRRLYYSPAMMAALVSNVDKYDLVHLHSVFLWPTWAAARAARKAGVPYVISPRGMLVKDLIKRRSRWLKTAWIALIEKKNLFFASGVHSTSKMETEEMLALDIQLQSLPFEIPNGVALPALSKQLDIRASEIPFVLALGRISWKKQLELSMQAVAKVPDLNFVIAGPDDENLTPALRQMAAGLGIADRVRFAGSVSGVEKDQLLQQALALMITSISENFGNVVLESMAAARPVLCVPQVGAAEIVVASQAGAVVNPEAESLAEILSHWKDNPATADLLGERGRHWVKLYYSWDTIAARMESQYRSILGMESC